MLKGETISSSIYRIYIAFSFTWQQVAVRPCQSEVVVEPSWISLVRRLLWKGLKGGVSDDKF
ncbi:hypothetical protein KY284_003211 [Solanum tuberosum]|nr:hypothetical protein KY284_003211 [Solanum tuberosum]